MDELVIDGQTYVSTKQAAKDTGYAKDYVGQLCREGRVTARLVGRSWYVLASSIREHRFGGEANESVPASKESLQAKEPSVAVTHREPPSLAWEPARYQPVTDTPLPNINRLIEDSAEKPTTHTAPPPPEPIKDEESEVPDMQTVWSEWFDRAPGEVPTPYSPHVIDNSASVDGGDTSDTSSNLEAVAVHKQTEAVSPKQDDDMPVRIQLHSIEEVSETTTTPSATSERDWQAEERAEKEAVQQERARQLTDRTRAPQGSFALRIVAFAIGVLAIGTAAIACLGSGLADNYLISFKQASPVTGISVYKSK